MHRVVHAGKYVGSSVFDRPAERIETSYLAHFETIRVPFYLVWGSSILVSAWSAYELGVNEPIGLAVAGGLASVMYAGAIARNRLFDKVLVGMSALFNLAIVVTLWNSELFDPVLIDLSP